MNWFFAVDARSRRPGSRALWLAALLGLMACPPLLPGQPGSPLHKVRGIGLDSMVVGRVTTFFAPDDQGHAAELAALTDAAAEYFTSEFGSGFPLHLAVLQPDTWFDPYQDGAPAPYGMPWGWIPESLMGVPASLQEGILIVGPDEQANLRRVRFVMLHEYGHLAAKQYLHPRGEQLYSSVRWFEEMVATYFAYAFVHNADAEWARAGRQEWTAFVAADAPASATLDWSFMYRLPPQQFGRTYAWYQNMLNVRAADVYAEHGLRLLTALRDRLPWSTSEEWTTGMLLPLLDSIAPGFQSWADGLQEGRYISRPDQDAPQGNR